MVGIPSKPVTQAWSNFTHYFPPQYLGEKNFALQVMLDRILKKIIRNEAEARHHMHARTRSEFLKPLTATESNAIRYTAGYVAVKLLKKAKKNTKNPDSRKKRHLFINVLEKMKAGLLCTLSDYSSQWSELIDHGRLYHVNEDVYNLIESIEMIIRQELQTTNYTANGVQLEFIEEFIRMLDTAPCNQNHCTLSMDEMKIKSGLVFNKLGFIDLGRANHDII